MGMIPFRATVRRDFRVAVALLLSLGFHALAFGQFARLFNPQSTLSDVASLSSVAGAPRGLLSIHLDGTPTSANLAPLSLATEPVVQAAPAQLKLDSSDHIQPNIVPSKLVAQAPQAPKVAAGAADPEKTASLQDYLKPSDVDSTSHPLNAPDVSGLGAADQYTGQVVRLRIYVDTGGKVVHVDALPKTHAEEFAITAIEQAITETQFIPAMLHNKPVASFTDVELSVEALQPLPSSRVHPTSPATQSN